MAKAQFQNKLSKAYRFKKKIGKVKKRHYIQNANRNEIKKARIVVRNLPFTVTEEDINQLYKPFGRIEEINLLKRPDGKLVGCGFVQFEKVEDASKAIFQTNKTNFLGRTISSAWAIPKSEFAEIIKKEEVINEESIEENVDKEANFEEKPEQNEEKSETSEKSEKKKKKDFSKKNQLSKTEQRKQHKLKKRQKRSRIVIRNLSFQITDEALQEHFSKYGNIEEIKILRKPDGAPTGVCFLQYDRVQSAAQAIHYENMKNLLERPMVVDWAIPKDKFQKQNENPEIKTEEGEDDDEVEVVKEEKNESFNPAEIKIKEEKESDDEDEIKQADESDKYDSDSKKNSEYDDDSDDMEEEDEDDKKNVKMEFDNQSINSSQTSSHPRRISNDVNEGKTVFIKNVPFSVTNDDLKECMLQFGPVYYALICIDRLTEHSKGTAFVKFVNVEDAEKCLSAGTELKLHDQVLDPHRALHKNDLNRMNEEKKHKVKDSRNLYLVKEGVILAGSPAAQDVSASDMAKRLQLEQWKSQMLRNLNMFVSRVRLVIQNLPENCEDSKLRELLKKHSNPGAVITECRVMRDLKNVDSKGVGRSKEHAFVSFSKHEDALRALRSLNNNPNIFSKAKRPIVAFSIENRVMVNAKQKRLERSRSHNPTWRAKRSADEESQPGPPRKSDDKPVNKRFKKNKQSAGAESRPKNGGSEEVESFAGATSKPGNTRMNGKFFLKKQAAKHLENLKQQKKQKKNFKRQTVQKIEQIASRKEAKPKQGHKKPDADEIHFNKLVNNYKKKLSDLPNIKSKWYESTT